MAASTWVGEWRRRRRTEEVAETGRKEEWLTRRIARRVYLYGDEDPKVADAYADLADFYISAHSQGLAPDEAPFLAEQFYLKAKTLYKKSCVYPQGRLPGIERALQRLSVELDKIPA